jgi:3-oxo-5-alpha-steroid 4-dehydrogenase 3
MLQLLAVTFFLSGIVTTLLGNVSPAIQKLSYYGKTLTQKTNSTLALPKPWFIHFYILAAFLGYYSLFIVYDSFSDNHILIDVLGLLDSPISANNMFANGWTDWMDDLVSNINEWKLISTTHVQKPLTTLVLLLLGTIQGTRRLYECVYVMKYKVKTGASRVAEEQRKKKEGQTAEIESRESHMLLTHYLVGMGFYVAVFCSLWATGVAGVRDMEEWDFDYNSVGLSIAISLFLVASTLQYLCHVHLSSLIKYSLPTFWPFKITVCPHYTCEALIYMSYIGVSLSTGSTPNYGLLLAPLFTLTVLTTSAKNSKDWYKQKFPEYNVRWLTIPGVL